MMSCHSVFGVVDGRLPLDFARSVDEDVDLAELLHHAIAQRLQAGAVGNVRWSAAVCGGPSPRSLPRPRPPAPHAASSQLHPRPHRPVPAPSPNQCPTFHPPQPPSCPSRSKPLYAMCCVSSAGPKPSAKRAAKSLRRSLVACVVHNRERLVRRLRRLKRRQLAVEQLRIHVLMLARQPAVRQSARENRPAAQMQRRQLAFPPTALRDIFPSTQNTPARRPCHW